ncbi:MAG: hypothetical protein HY297_03250 [Thaumarchaeota archaeon]|nr:hypothetical protein [Nitrososphaerota archaeon]
MAATTALKEAESLRNGAESVSPALAVLLVVSGERERGLALLEVAQRRDPTNAILTHALFLGNYFAGHVAENGASAPSATSGTWERTIAAWVMLLHCDAFWKELRARFHNRYGLDEEGEAAVVFREQIEGRVGILLNRAFDRTGDPLKVRRLLLREMKGAEQIRSLGGIPVTGQNGATVVCGPLAVRLFGLENALGNHIVSCSSHPVSKTEDPLHFLFNLLLNVDVSLPSEGQADSAQVTRTARYFSSLGPIQTLLDAEQHEEALAAFAEIPCPRCGRLRQKPEIAPGADDWLPEVCIKTCPEFDGRNPAFRAFPAKGERLREAALELAVDVRLSLAQAAIRKPQIDLQGAAVNWRDALRLARSLAQNEPTQHRVVETILARVSALEKKRNYGDAIALIEAVKAMLDASIFQKLAGRLAELLADRGVAAANGSPPRWKAAVVDLRRAVKLNPHAARPVVNFGVALRAYALERFREGAADDTGKLLQECLLVLRAGSLRFLSKPNLQKQLDLATGEFRTFSNAHAVELANRREFESALRFLDEALQLLPNDTLLANNHFNILMGYAMSLTEKGDHHHALVVFDQAERRYGHVSTAMHQLNKVKILAVLAGKGYR